PLFRMLLRGLSPRTCLFGVGLPPIGASVATSFPGGHVAMHIELNHAEAEAVRDLLQQRVTELDKEINRTDSLTFKNDLRQLERTIERVLGGVSSALEGADGSADTR